jgi:colanic acid/amylovoran biosynthesis glycosyltransferase
VNLIVFTSSYPYVRGGEQNFLNVEVRHLLDEFDRVVFVPETVEGSRFGDLIDAEVDISYAEYLASHSVYTIFLKGLFSPFFRRGMMESNFPRFSSKAYRRLVAFAGKAEITHRWTINWLHRQKLNGRDCLFYTYWFDQASGGIGLAKRQVPELRLISRAHGYDIYEEQYYDPPFFPCRAAVLKLVDRVFPASFAGETYFIDHYRSFSALFETALLGVPDPGFLSYPSQDSVFRMISCSMIRPEKRVEKILEGVIQAALLRPEQHFEWTHVGNGAIRDDLQNLANKNFPPNAKAFFPGYSDNATLLQLYKEKPFDVFINVSKTEGTPVSIMEAISCGIPVIATAVGGNTEIVSTQNGILISPNAALEEISSAIFYLIDHPGEAEMKRKGSRYIWETHYNAHLNFSNFAKRLKDIRLAS